MTPSASPPVRCPWCGDDPLYRAYHDEQWGVPERRDHALFEMLILEGAQAGLSWLTVLRRREHYRQAFDGFNPELVARYDQRRIDALLADPGIIRNRLKVASAVRNARVTLALQERHGSLSSYLWGVLDTGPVQNHRATMAQLPAQTEASDRLSKALKGQGMNFVGSTICYAFMQAVGMVNDHLITCFRHAEVAAMS